MLNFKFTYLFLLVSVLTYGQKIDSLSKTTVLKEVIVESKKIDEVGNSFELSQKQIQNIPSFIGERDFIKTLTLLPGIKTDNESSSNIFIRGGNYDQNLFLIDNIPVFGGNHLTGLISPFNPEMIESVEILKNGFPAEYGGRLSSILSIRQRINLDSSQYIAGMGILMGKVYVNKVLKPQKIAIMVAARRSFYDLFYSSNNNEGSMPTLNFLDANVKATYQYDKNNQLNLILFISKDAIYNPEIDTSYKFSNHIKGLFTSFSIGLNWLKTYKKHSLEFVIYNSQLNTKYENFTTNYSEIQKTYFGNGISEIGLKGIDNFKLLGLQTKIGFSFLNYQFVPASFKIYEFGSNQAFSLEYAKIYAQILSLFYSAQYIFKDKTLIDFGARVNNSNFKSNYHLSFEPRLNVKHELTKNSNIRFSFTQMNQFLHLLINPGTGINLDTWVPSSKNFPNEKSQQINLGYDVELFKNRYLFTIDTYYKNFKNIIYYIDGYDQNSVYSEEFVRNGFESIIDKGIGSARGLEVLFQKKKGRLNGWISYDLSWVKYEFPQVNSGQSFFPRFDRRHNISIVSSLYLGNFWTFNTSWVYQTGQPFPIPNYLFGVPNFNYDKGSFDISETNNPQIGINQGTRDSYRTQEFHRLNISFIKEIQRKRVNISWEFGLYNVYNRKNPYVYFYKNVNGKFQVVSYSILPILPSISYRISF